MRGRHARAIFEVFDAERYAGQGARVTPSGDGAIDGPGGSLSRVPVEEDEGSQLRIQVLDRAATCSQGVERRALAVPDGMRDGDSRFHPLTPIVGYSSTT